MTNSAGEIYKPQAEHPLFRDSLIALGDIVQAAFCDKVLWFYSPKAQIPSVAADCYRVQLLIAFGEHFLRAGRPRALRQPDRDNTRVPEGNCMNKKDHLLFFF